MALTTIADIRANLQQPNGVAKQGTGTVVAGRPFSYWAQSGIPAAGSYDTTLNGVTLTSPVTGQIRYDHPASGNAYYAALRYHCLNATNGLFLIADRLWHNGGITITSTSAQSITSPTWPARDENGSTNGEGVILAVEVSGAVGAGTPTITISYTNQSGTAGRTATNIVATTASVVAGTTYFIGLQSGDTGVRSVQSITLSATWTSGTINIVALRPLAFIPVTSLHGAGAEDPISLGFPKTYSGTVPYIIYVPFTTGNSGISMDLIPAHG